MSHKDSIDKALRTFRYEYLLTRRAISQEVGEALIERIRWWEDYAEKLDGEINNNPTPGNKLGGLTTILERSLDAICKAGSTNLVSVLRYAEPVKKPGMHLMDSPGYDPMSITGEVADRIYKSMLATASGTQTKSEAQGFGDSEFVPWNISAQM